MFEEQKAVTLLYGTVNLACFIIENLAGMLFCCELAQEVMREGWNPVIIDNTNLQAWQMLPYVRLVCCFDHFNN